MCVPLSKKGINGEEDGNQKRENYRTHLVKGHLSPYIGAVAAFMRFKSKFKNWMKLSTYLVSRKNVCFPSTQHLNLPSDLKRTKVYS